MSSKPQIDEGDGAEQPSEVKSDEDGQPPEASRAGEQPPRTKPRKKRARPAARDHEAVVVDEASLERHSRRALAIGSTLLMIGLALLGMGPSDLGTWITLAALVALIYGVHTFGRLGPPGGSDARPTPDGSRDVLTNV